MSDNYARVLRFHARDHKPNIRNSFAEIHTQTLLNAADRIEELEAQLKIHDEIIAEKLEQIYRQSTRIEELEAELLKERRENEAAGNRIRELRECLYDCLEYLTARQDVEDNPSGFGPPVPDETMRLAHYVEETINDKVN